MPTNKELSDKVDELQSALDDEQAQVRQLIDSKNATIKTLEETVTTLQGQVADGGTAEERQAVLDKMNTLLTDLKGTDLSDAPAAGNGE